MKNLENELRKRENAKNFSYQTEPILRFGHPCPKAEDDDDDDSLDLPSILNASKSPFSVISSNLYNIDYNNRIIVIDEQINERCFVYAKMIENWNREDKIALDLKEEIKEIVEEYPEVKPLFEGFRSTDDDLEKAKSKVEDEAGVIIDNHPELVQKILKLQSLKIPQFKILDYEPSPIKIKFNSPGGWILAYQTLSDVISLSKTKIIGINMGMAYSAAAFLLIACHERLALPKSRMLIHRGSGGNFGTFEQTESSQQNYKEQVNEMIDAFAKRTNIPMKMLKKKLSPDWYLSANDALEYGLIDRIVTDISEII